MNIIPPDARATCLLFLPTLQILLPINRDQDDNIQIVVASPAYRDEAIPTMPLNYAAQDKYITAVRSIERSGNGYWIVFRCFASLSMTYQKT